MSTNGTQVEGRIRLSVRRSQRGWRVLAELGIAGEEVTHFGPEYTTQEAARVSLARHMSKLIAALDKHGLQHGEPEGFV